MKLMSHRQPIQLLLALPLTPMVLLAGCGSGERIHTYTVPKGTATPVAAEVPVGEPTHRMLAAILPAGDQAWFFKVVGSLEAVEKRAPEINKFFTTLRLTENGRPQWDLPEDWKEEQGTGMRAATIRIPADDEPLELSVIGLPWRGTPDEVLSNVNRWREQMKLPELSQEQLPEATREIKAEDATITVVDLRGHFDGGGAMMPPFAGAAGSRAGGSAELPPGHPPIDPAPHSPQPGQSAPAPVAAPKLEAPEDWQQQPAAGMRKADYQIGDDEKGARVTVIDFPASAGPKIADPLENVNRWRSEVGMPPINKDQLEQTSENVEVDGHPAVYVKLIPDPAERQQSQPERATLGALVNAGERIWFFKMTGDRDVVDSQVDAFESFLKSARFVADRGAGDGDR
jgi:hypothetical protein